MKLSERLGVAAEQIEAARRNGTTEHMAGWEADVIREAAALSRRVEDAPEFTAERISIDSVVADITGHASHGQRVRLVPEAGLGGGDV